MNVSLTIFLLTLSAISLAAARHTLRIMQSIRTRKELCDEGTGCYESLGFVGCSVICSAVDNLYHIEQLLNVEYDRYEVIIVLDAQLHTEKFAHIIAHYRMIKVNCSPSDELPTARIRNLYRSSSRNFRRLVLIDCEQRSAYDDFDAAASVASYKFLLPIRSHTLLHRHAIESAAIILSESNYKNIELLISHVGKGCYIFRRQTIIEHGGFSSHLIREINKKATLDIYLPTSYTPHTFQHIKPTLKVAIFCTIVTLFLTTWITWGVAAVAALGTTLILICAAGFFSARLYGERSWSSYNIFWFFRQMCSFFRPRKFIV